MLLSFGSLAPLQCLSMCRSPFPTTGTPLHPIREESKSPTSAQGSKDGSPSDDGINPLRALPFMSGPGPQQAAGNDEDEMIPLPLGGDLIQRSPPVRDINAASGNCSILFLNGWVAQIGQARCMQGQASVPSGSALTPPSGHVHSPRRAPLSPLADVSARAFMQTAGMQQEIDECKLPRDVMEQVTCMQVCGPVQTPGNTSNHTVRT